MGGMNIAEHKVPQDGHAMDLRPVATALTCVFPPWPRCMGRKSCCVCWISPRRLSARASWGWKGRDLENYNALLKNSSGVILLVGPTGSGKSTTMCNMLRDLSREEINIVTLEDPVEYHIPGVSQCQINEKTGMTFASGLRAILRQDPDIIAVGEIRDGETGTIAIGQPSPAIWCFPLCIPTMPFPPSTV